MIRGTEEPLSLTSEPSGALAEVSSGQKCTTPCQVVLKRNQSIMIKFSKDGYEPETVSVFPTLAGAGVILGGVIDYGTGAVYSLTPNPAHAMLKPKAAQPPVAASIEPVVPEKPKSNLEACIEDVKAKKGTSAKVKTAASWCSEGKITKEERNALQAAIIRGEI